MAKATQIVSAFTEEQAARLTGVSKSQLRYWDRTRFFVPSLAYEDRRSAFSRLYSFRDLACLKVINDLRNEGRVPLPRLRNVKERLAHLGDDLWARTTLYVLNREVVFEDPETHAPEEVLSGQTILSIPLKAVSGEIEGAVRTLRQRDPSRVGKIERQRNIARNEPVVAGTGIPVRGIKAFSNAGFSIAAIQGQYPTLTVEDIQAAIAYDQAA